VTINLPTNLRLLRHAVVWRNYGYDPLLSKEEIRGFDVNAPDILDVNVDGVIVAVAHDEFKKMGLEDIGKFMDAKPVLIDVIGMFDGEEAKRKGFYYRGL
jgi:UDPglucose 6-dehydrogenase/UDP-N-acetyl-D-galactosamine dehydrogenase